MDDLFEALANNGFAFNDRTLEYVIAHTAQCAQYSLDSRKNLEVLMKYEEYKSIKIGVLKKRFLMKDCST
jgi:hypothetical protein